MSHRTQILAKIEQAMKFACDQSELFTDAIAEPIAAEYLFTVAVAMKISELNGPPGDPYVIRVERDAETFTRDCLPPMKIKEGNGIRRKMIVRRVVPDVDRKGRIDVTVYTDKPNNRYWGVQPLCAIEVKGFDPAKELVLEDLRRNLTFLKAEGDTGASCLEFTAFAAFHSYRRTNDSQIIANEARVKRKYEKYLSCLDNLSGIDAKVQTINVSLDQQGRIIQGVDYDEIDVSTRHHIVGAMVIMSRTERGLVRGDEALAGLTPL